MKKNKTRRKSSGDTQQITRSPNHRNFNRAATLTPESFDAKTRSFSAVLSTPIPVRIYDWQNDRYVDEVLLPWGCRPVEHVMFLDRHNEYENTAVIGSVSEIVPNNVNVTGRTIFSSAPDVELLFIRTKEGHLRAVSVGGDYSISNTVEIAPGRSKTFRDLVLTATDVPMVVAKVWELQHVGLVQRGADANALIRDRKKEDQAATQKNSRHTSQLNGPETPTISNRSGKTQMRFSTRALKYLQECGLAAGANKSTTMRFCNQMTPTQLHTLFNRDRNAAKIIETNRRNTPRDDHNSEEKEAPRRRTADRAAPSRSRSTVRSGATNRPRTGGAGDTMVIDPPHRSNRNRSSRDRDDDRDERKSRRSQVSEDVMLERERVRTIRELADSEIPQHLVERAIDSGWSVEETKGEYYEYLKRQSRSHTPRRDPNQASGYGAAVHSRRADTIQGLQAGLMARFGCEWDSKLFRKKSMQAMCRREAKWLWRATEALADKAELREDHARALDSAHRNSELHLAEVCKRMLKASGKRVPSDQDSLMRAAFSTSDLPKTFGPAVNYKIMEAFEAQPDPTVGWVKRTDWSDFRMNDLLAVDPASRLKPHTRNTPAKQIELQERSARYALSRFVGKFQLDEMDVINDRLGMLDDLLATLGQLARDVPIDMVIAAMLANTASPDGTAMFHANHNNLLTSSPFTPDNIELLEALVAGQTMPQADGTVKALNLTAGHIVVPRSRRLKAKKYLTSVTRTDANGDQNPLSDEFRYHSDARFDKGVTNPLTGAWVAGAPTAWWMFENTGRFAYELGFRTGTGRGPMTRSMPIRETGVWAWGWDVNMDCGLGITDYRGAAQGIS